MEVGVPLAGVGSGYGEEPPAMRARLALHFLPVWPRVLRFRRRCWAIFRSRFAAAPWAERIRWGRGFWCPPGGWPGVPGRSGVKGGFIATMRASWAAASVASSSAASGSIQTTCEPILSSASSNPLSLETVAFCPSNSSVPAFT